MSEQKTEKKKTGLVIGIIIGVIIIALLAVIIFLLLRPKPEEGELPNRGLIDNTHKEEVVDAAADKVAEGMFECKMNMDWTFEDGKSETKDAYVANAETNTHTIYFDLVDEDTGEVWYKSPYIKIGEELTNFKLDKELEAGVYKPIVQYTLVDEQADGTYKEVSSAGFRITLTVLK